MTEPTDVLRPVHAQNPSRLLADEQDRNFPQRLWLRRGPGGKERRSDDRRQGERRQGERRSDERREDDRRQAERGRGERRQDRDRRAGDRRKADRRARGRRLDDRRDGTRGQTVKALAPWADADRPKQGIIDDYA